MLHILAIIAGVLSILTVLWETFETIVLPRRVTRQFRLTRFFYRGTWSPFAALVSRIGSKKRRETIFAFYGPMSLLLLLAFWAVGLVVGFALLHYGTGSVFTGAISSNRFSNALYMSGSTFFTLGLGDITPVSRLARFITVFEAGIGFGFLALVIGYLPVLYQAFSHREVTISLLDARAGSPPTVTELLRRHAGPNGEQPLERVLEDWERWSAELMESHLSYPALAYFRSQHDNQSWLGSLTTILDLCALIISGFEENLQYQARMTFAIARHALVDLSQIFGAPPVPIELCNRLPAEQRARLRKVLHDQGFNLADGPEIDEHLEHLRSLYEPYAISMSRLLCIDLPPWIREGVVKDNWKTTAWNRDKRADVAALGDHF